MVKMKAPKGATFVGFEGVEYPIKKGVVEVPDEAVEALSRHGFVRIDDGEQAEQ